MRRALLAWYDKNQRDLPWRRTRDPYKIWVSEVMLQQTQVKTVVPYYLRFIETFPTLKHLARAAQQEVLKIWEGLGYYSRARNLHRAAGIVVAQFNEKVPNNWESIRKLPGIGEYIAAAVLSIADNQPYAVVDGNVKRVMARLLKIEAPVNHSSSDKTFKSAAARLLDTESPGKFNQAVMELGALICKPVSPYCGKCPLHIHCRAFKSATVDVYPKRLKAKPIPRVRLTAGVVCKDSRVLITQRRNDGLLGGLWEFPGGKIRESESSEDACLRAIKAEVALQVNVRRFLTRVKHAYTHFRITLDVYICDYRSGHVSLNGPVDHRWVTLDELDDFPFPKANLKFIHRLRRTLTEETEERR
jgi:A/G-specific adenine glycosylase